MEWWKRSNFFCNVSANLTSKVKVTSYFLFLSIFDHNVLQLFSYYFQRFIYFAILILSGKQVIRSTNCSTSEIDFIAKESSMVTSSSTLSISFRCSGSLPHPITVSMTFWQDSCRQAMFLTSIDGCDITTSPSKSMFSAAETSVESSLTKLSNSSSSVNYCFLRDFIPSRFYPRDCF